MLHNYITVATRHLFKHRLYSFINIMGLSIGMAACLLIFVFVRYETSYNNWMPEAERVYRLNYTNFYPNGEDFVCACAPGIAKGALDKRFAEIESSTRIYQSGQIIKVGDRSQMERYWFVDSNIFQTFKFDFVEGDEDSALNELNAVVLSEELATKYFPNQSPLGEVITIPQDYMTEDFKFETISKDFMVTGVIKDIPENSEFNFDIIIPLDNDLYQYTAPISTRWFNTWGFLYFKLKDGVDPNVISSGLDGIVANEVESFDDRTPNETIELSIVNLLDTHLHSEDKNFGVENAGSITQVYTFSIIAMLVLVIACINFMNLSTARSMQRAREISMRKVLGANRPQLIRQFLGESLLVAMIALVIAVIMVMVALPMFNNMSDMTLSFNVFIDPMVIGAIVGLLFIIGLVAGLYPALYLSSFRPAEILSSGGLNGQSGGALFRNGLTIFQFSISIALIITTAVVYGQNIYSVTKDLGYEKENKLILYGVQRMENKEAMMEEIRRLPDVDMVSNSQAFPTFQIGWHNDFTLLDEPTAEEQLISAISIDPDFFPLYKIPILLGRNFDQTREIDRLLPSEDNETYRPSTVIINETAARQFGFSSSSDALGRLITWGGDRDLEIIGIVPDYQFNSSHTPQKSLVYMYYPEQQFHLSIDISDSAVEANVRQDISEIWKQFAPAIDPRLENLEDLVRRQYLSENRQGQMLLSFSVLTVIVACLGLYGLAAFTAEQRTHEIAVRKVLGAEVSDVVKLLLLQFSKPVLIANFIAWPVAWYFSQDFLNGFTYRIDLGFSYFLFTGILAVVIAWITTTHHAVKAARTNPAKVLRSE